ncbi:sensor domain-containing phosphodiesterase, partial [Klebsiella pneumoniae]|nr:sensor domain-containing phosphodiesterase [Klebsiella pneumoniae]
MTAVENLLRNMVAELQIRLPLEGPLYAVAVGRFAFFTHKEKIRTLEDISQSLQGIQARFTPEVPLDLDIHMGDSGLCHTSLTSNEIL